MRDYYKILGISETASDDEIKQAYKKLAKQYHPDRNPGDKRVEEKFKEMSEAYNCLSDPKKRKEYDAMRRFGGQRGFGSTMDADFDWRDFMKDFRAQARGFGQTTSFSDLFDDVFFGSQGRTSRELEVEVTIPFTKAVTGGDVDFQYSDGGTKTLRIKLPEGISDGEKIRVHPAGHKPVTVIVRIQPDDRFTRKGQDVYCEVQLNFAQLTMGSTVRVATVYGNQVDVRIPQGTQPGTVFKLAGLGVKTVHRKGDMFVTVTVAVPRHLSRKQKELLDAFAKESGMSY